MFDRHQAVDVVSREGWWLSVGYLQPSTCNTHTSVYPTDLLALLRDGNLNQSETLRFFATLRLNILTFLIKNV